MNIMGAQPLMTAIRAYSKPEKQLASPPRQFRPLGQSVLTRPSPGSDNPTYLAQRERIYDGMRKAGVPEG
jgi:hypothetical protein